MFRPLIAAAGFVVAGVMAFAAPVRAQPAHAQQYAPPGSAQVRCESRNYRYQRCNANWRDARILRQISSTQCRRDDTWGIDRRGLWVDRGCTAIFVEAGGGPGYGGGWHPGNNWDRDIRLTCQSQDYRYKLCQVDTGQGGRVRIERQISNTRCVLNQTWGFNRAGVWVNQGCAAVFVIERRWR